MLIIGDNHSLDHDAPLMLSYQTIKSLYQWSWIKNNAHFWIVYRINTNLQDKYFVINLDTQKSCIKRPKWIQCIKYCTILIQKSINASTSYGTIVYSLVEKDKDTWLLPCLFQLLQHIPKTSSSDMSLTKSWV